MGETGWPSVGLRSVASGRQKLGSDHQPLFFIFFLYRCKVSLTTVLNSGFLDEVSMEIKSTIPPDLDPSFILIVPVPIYPSLNPAYYHSG